MKEHFGTLRSENILKVFNTALDLKKTTRTDLEKRTGLSFVTVSKIVDALVEADILKQSYTTDPIQTRKSRLINTKTYYWTGVYSFDSSLFKFSILDLSSRCIDEFTYVPSKELFIDDSVRDFLKKSVAFTKKVKKKHPCIGTAVLFCGFYDQENESVISSDIPHFRSVNIKQLISEYSFGTETYIRSVFNEYICMKKEGLSDDNNIFSLFLNKGNILSSYITNSDNRTITLANTGMMEAYKSKSINKITAIPPEPTMFFERITDILFTLLHTVPISEITVCGNLYSRVDATAKVLQKHLLSKCEKVGIIAPMVTGEDMFTLAAQHISREIRTDWLKNIIE